MNDETRPVINPWGVLAWTLTTLSWLIGIPGVILVWAELAA